MAPNSVVAPPPKDEAKKEAVETRSAPTRTAYVTAAASQRDWLGEALLELSSARQKRNPWSYVASIFIQTLLLVTLLAIPLFFTEAIDLKQFTQTFLVAPPPPPPPPPPATQAIVKVVRAPKVFQLSGKLVAPTVIPKEVAMLKESSDEGADIGAGVVGGVPGGVPGGQAGGVIGGIISGAPKAYIPAAPPPVQRAPIRVGGRVMAPRVIAAPDPIYPPLAKQARIQGDVQIDAVIDINGNVVEMNVMNGHPLLIPSALDALRRWKYQPTILNDEPVPVQLIVTIRFRMN